MPLSEQEEFELLSLKRKMGANEGGAVTGRIQQPSLQMYGAQDALTDVASATTIGAGLGAVLPEMLTGAGAAASSFPATAGAGNALMHLGRAARGAGRAAGASAGALAGGAGEVAAQAIDGLGGGTGLQEAARFFSGGLTPSAVKGVGNAVIQVFKKKLPTSMEAAFLKNLSIKIADRMQGKNVITTAEENAYFNKTVSEIRGGKASNAPIEGLYDILKTGASNKMAAASAEAGVILNKSAQEIRTELAKAGSGGLNEVSETGLRETSKRALATAEMQRLNIGDDIPPSEIGNSLRSVVVRNNEAQLLKKNADYDALKNARDGVIAVKEGAGVFIGNLKQHADLVKELESELSPGKHSNEVVSSFQKILSNISPVVSQQGAKSQRSFEAIDEVRRNLGKVFEGEPPTGYEAISADIARKYYGKISNLQKEFGGKPQEELLNQYASAMKGGEVFLSKGAKRLTATDRLAPDFFQVDAKTLPSKFFSSTQGVRDILTLVGNRGAVVKAAKDFSTAEIAGMNEKQVRSWMTKNREMLGALHEVRDSVLSYANTLEKGERIAAMAESGILKLKSAGADAGKVISQRAAEAASLIKRGDFFKVDNIESMLFSPKSTAEATKDWTTAAYAIHSAPGGRQMFADALRQVFANKAEKSTAGIADVFEKKVYPAIVATRLMSTTQAQKMLGQLKRIETLQLPEKEKLGLINRIVLQGFGAMAAGHAGRGARTSLEYLIPPTTRESLGQGVQ